jgi:DNA-binding GntR family transcriptional regulator
MKLTDNIYNQVKQDVFQAKYKSNELISERQIAEKYSISKLTASEVLHRLCTEGHLTSYPRSGYMVTTLSPKEMDQLKRLRITIEALVIHIVSEEASDEKIRSLYDDIYENFSETDNAAISNFKFHMDLARLTNDNLITNIMETILGSASRVEQSVSVPQYNKWQAYHKGIIDCLLKRDADAAQEWLIKDINQR